MERIEIKRDKKRIVRSLILGILSLLLIGVLIIVPREALVSHSDFGYWVLKIFSFIVLPLAVFQDNSVHKLLGNTQQDLNALGHTLTYERQALACG